MEQPLLLVNETSYNVVYEWARRYTDPSPSKSRAQRSSALYQHYLAHAEGEGQKLDQTTWGLVMKHMGYPIFSFQGIRKRMLVLVDS